MTLKCSCPPFSVSAVGFCLPDASRFHEPCRSWRSVPLGSKRSSVLPHSLAAGCVSSCCKSSARFLGLPFPSFLGRTGMVSQASLKGQVFQNAALNGTGNARHHRVARCLAPSVHNASCPLPTAFAGLVSIQNCTKKS